MRNNVIKAEEKMSKDVQQHSELTEKHREAQGALSYIEE